jgi:hypothetical protein
MMSMKVGQVAVASLRVRRLQASVLIADLAVLLSLSEQGDTEVARGVILSALGLSALRKIFGAANPPQASTFLSQLLSPTRTQLIEISSTLKESPVRWRSLMSSEMSSDQSSKVKDIVRISGAIENVDLQLRIELSFQPCK